MKNCSTMSQQKTPSIIRFMTHRLSMPRAPRKATSTGVTTAVKMSAANVTRSHRRTARSFGDTTCVDARRSLYGRHPEHVDALANGRPAHEALARRFAHELWCSDDKAAARGETGPSPEILKHYYTKIANWVKRRPDPHDSPN